MPGARIFIDAIALFEAMNADPCPTCPLREAKCSRESGRLSSNQTGHGLAELS